MPLHKAPETAAEHLALHLEQNYGLQLDPVRHSQLVKELDKHLCEYFNKDVAASVEATASAYMAVVKEKAAEIESLKQQLAARDAQ